MPRSARALDSGWYILGAEGRAFEAEFAAWLGARHAVGCGNGTDALALALRALASAPAATVVTVSHTAVATVAAIEIAGATPLLIDIEPDHLHDGSGRTGRRCWMTPPAGVPPIRAVIPVHLYGQAADLAPIMAACAKTSARSLIEDCARRMGRR